MAAYRVFEVSSRSILPKRTFDCVDVDHEANLSEGGFGYELRLRNAQSAFGGLRENMNPVETFNHIEITQIPQTSDRGAFFDRLTRANDEGTLFNLFNEPDRINFTQFHTTFKELGYSNDSIISGFLHLKKEQFRSYDTGNAVNYLAKVAEGILTENQEAAFKQAIESVLRLVTEYPKAEAIGVDEQTFQWVTGENGRHLDTGFGLMDDVLEQALHSSQTTNFEVPRFEANKSNYNKLREARARGDHSTFAEISVSPRINTEATARGYLGNDCIFFYIYDERNNQEIVVQRWLRTGWNNFENLLRDLGRDIPENATDVDIMRASDFFSESEIGHIESFINMHNGSLSARRESIEEYVQGELRSFIEREAGQILWEGAQALIRGDDITPQGKALIETLVYAQLKLRNKLSDLTGLKTVAPIQMSNYNHVDFALLETNQEARAAFFQEHKETKVLAGCGTSVVEDIFSQIKGTSGGDFASAFGAAGGMGGLLFGEDKYGSLTFECPSCHQVNTRESGKLKSNCDHCHKTIPGCGPERTKAEEKDEKPKQPRGILDLLKSSATEAHLAKEKHVENISE